MRVEGSMTIRVLIADDHPLVRSGIRSELSRRAAEFEVVGEALSGDEALSLAEALRPDVLLLDVNMPGLKAIEVLKAVKKQSLAGQVLILTAYGDTATILGMLNAGADGYVLKDDDPLTLPEAIHTVVNGGAWFSQAVSEKLITVAKGKKEAALGDGLTKREQEVLHFLSEGSTNKAIAIALQTSERTVEFHVSNLLKKLGMKGRWEAVIWAREHGLL
jgi:two-component system nitrate/nitrite response regulator NarL